MPARARPPGANRQPWAERREQCQEDRLRQARQEETHHAGGTGQKYRFGEQLPDEAPPSGAHRHSHGHFSLPRAMPRFEQSSHRATRHQQHQTTSPNTMRSGLPASPRTGEIPPPAEISLTCSPSIRLINDCGLPRRTPNHFDHALMQHGL